MSRSVFRARSLAALGGTAAVAIALTGCTAGDDGGNGGGGDDSIIVGTTDSVTSLDPAGSYDNGSFAVQNQVFPFLLNTPYGSPDVEPDIAESAEFTSPNQYTVTLKEGLTWANGNELTSSDVKFTFDRQLAIADANGPSSLLGNLESVETPDETTVVFNLVNPNDQTFPQVLSSPAGPIVDEDVFSATELTPDQEIVDGNAFAGQYTITSWELNSLVEFTANPDYQGLLGPAETENVLLSYYADSSNLRLDVETGEIDVAYRSLAPADIEDLRGNDDVNVVDGPGGEIRYIVWNFDTQPYGATTPEANADQATAVRQAAAALIDREQIAEQVYRGTFTPLYSFVPEGLTGATTSFQELYGENGGPSLDQATQILADAGVTTPVTLNLQYSPDHYGPSSGDEYALVESQLEEGGLFDVNLQSTEWTQYSADRTSDVYPVYQLGWFPDYSDADNYLTPFFFNSETTTAFLAQHFDDPEINALISQQATTADAAERTAIIEQIQDRLAEIVPTIPLLQGAQVAVTGTDIEGVTLDPSFKFRFAPLTRS
ncbi:ABC transporter substrate-binding protein [Herbiconiux sp. SYSU D00978]|uniref:ABC transporter substrate-binding protein n=1 Tax=Herbiconiux sp. SYSU D00978 TaxID=2812562 RepID=UPI001A96B897|nr:ABC transporter substrate-binding protein [Herbiconiux sp. SYSU D00978]